MAKRERYSKSERAEKLCGMRKKGQPLFLPHELGYSCPICGSSDEVNLHWGEYEFFLWCKKCNLDIPSVLCVKYYEPTLSDDIMNDKDRIKKATKLFLDCIEESKTR